jgi:hypothetical protein
VEIKRCIFGLDLSLPWGDLVGARAGSNGRANPMDSTFFASSRSWRISFPKILPLLFLTAALFPRSLQADTVMSLETLRISDQGSQLTLTWNFNYLLLPPTFILREKGSETISLNDPQTLRQNLSDVIPVAFDIRIDGQPAGPLTIEKLTVSPNQRCTVVLVCPGHPKGHVEVRAPILQYLPDSYFIYYEAFNIKNMGLGKSGFLGRKAPYQSLIDYTQLAADGSGPPLVPQVKPKAESVSSISFKAEIRTAWINYNWLLICVVLLLMQMPMRIVILVLSMIVCWILLCLLWVLADYKVPWQIPEIVLSLPTVLICIVTIQYPRRVVGLTLLTLAAGMLNACYDIQQIPLAHADKALPALIGLSLGFVGGLGLVLLVLVPLLWECKKYPQFQTDWAPKICWVVAAIAIIAPVQKFFFG